MALFSRKKRAEEDVEVEVVPPVELPPPPPGNAAGMRSVADHCEYLLSLVNPLPAFGMNLLDACGLALCEDIRGDGNIPPRACAQVDGYAVHADDILAGTHAKPWVMLSGVMGDSLGDGQAVAVQAGEALPKGSDTIIPAELCEVDAGGLIELQTPLIKGAWVNPMGGDIADGQVLIRTGQLLTPRHAAQLLAGGFDRILARPRTRVGVLSFVSPETAVQTGAVGGIAGVNHDVDSELLACAAKSDGATVVASTVVASDEKTVYEAVSDELIRSDLLLVTGCLGGVGGAGEASIDMIRSLGPVEVIDVAVQPGQRQGYGLIGDDQVPMILLPGGATAAFVAYQSFVRPLIRKIMGVKPYREQPIMCYAEQDFPSDENVLEFVLGSVREDDSRYLVSAEGNRYQHQLRHLVDANVLIGLPEGKSEVRAGDAVMCWFLDQI